MVELSGELPVLRSQHADWSACHMQHTLLRPAGLHMFKTAVSVLWGFHGGCGCCLFECFLASELGSQVCGSNSSSRNSPEVCR
jgi:hypothetical protein